MRDPGEDPQDGGAPGDYALRGNEGARLGGCHVELHAEGSVVLVVDGERLFRFESFEELLAHYDVLKGEIGSTGEHARASLASANEDLDAAEVAAAAHLAALHLQPRAQKALPDDRLLRLLERVRQARARVSALERP